MNIHNLPLETLVANCELKMASWSSEKAENSSPTFWLKIWRKFWFWRGKTGRVWCPEKWWFLLRLWFGILFCWRDEKFMLLPSQFWMACSTVLHKSCTTQRAVMQWSMQGLYAEASAISMVVHGVTLFDWVCNYKSPVSSVAFWPFHGIFKDYRHEK